MKEFAVVDLGGRFAARCVVARTAADQALGLQGFAPLEPGHGMLFPFDPPRAATFHMGRVAFALDLVFADAQGRVARLVHQAQPGAHERWSHSCASAVVELAGGTCSRAGVDVGDQLRIAGGSSYNLLRTLTEAEAHHADLGLDDGYYSKEPGLPGGVTTPREGVPPEERFKERRLPPEAFSEAMDQPNSRWREQIGYQPTQTLQEERLVGPSVRPSASRVLGQIQDAGKFVAAIVEGMARQKAPIPWQADALSPTDSAVITRDNIARWLEALELHPMGRQQAVQTAMSPSGLKTLANGLVLAGLADQAKVVNNNLVLHRGRR